MLENWRYNRALEACKKRPGPEPKNILLSEEYKTELALRSLGVNENTPPSEVSKVGRILIRPDLLINLRIPYAVEILGMPHSGKTTMINRYLEELWQRNERNNVALVEEGARSIEDEYGNLRFSDPFTYSLLGGTKTFINYVESIDKVSSGTRMIISDRGQIDRRVFRRALFQSGEVNPEIMVEEEGFMYGMENTPVQLGGIIMFMQRPHVTIKRGVTDNKEHPVSNMNFLPRLYEQYLRLHWEVSKGEIPYRLYACIDAEKSLEEVYERFKYAMDSALNLHQTLLTAFSQVFPHEFDKIKKLVNEGKFPESAAQKILSEKLGGRVKIVGGDDMESEDDILDRPFVEMIDKRKNKA